MALAPLPSEKVCANCAFWDNHGDPTRKGDCKKRAPIGVLTPAATRYTRERGEEVLSWNVVARWPLTNPADFCGKFERRD